jgi:hypothetical protein
MNYILNAPVEGNPIIKLYSITGLELCNGYNRIVIGGRGPYVEFTEEQVILKSFHIPKDQLYRLTDRRVYYIEMRSRDESFVKMYYQLQTVAYANYKIGMFYISPYELYLSNNESMAVSKIILPTENKFFE